MGVIRDLRNCLTSVMIAGSSFDAEKKLSLEVMRKLGGFHQLTGELNLIHL